MSNPLSAIDTIVIVMMENRSFDSMLGFLSLPPYSRPNVDGIRPTFSNTYKGKTYPVFHGTDPEELLNVDPLHERSNIATQMGTLTNNAFLLDGFVRNQAISENDGYLDRFLAFFHLHNPEVSEPPEVMAYWTADDLPAFKLFADHFTVCDHWFSCLPAGTQPNRLMAMSGTTLIDINKHILPQQELVYQWLDAHKVRWRVYHEGMFPFFFLMPDMFEPIEFSGHFQRLPQLQSDIHNMSDADFPQVIFIEPTYTDAPHPFLHPDDDHAKTPVGPGQDFLLRVYRTLTSNPERWKNTVMIVNYDEHGGFYDHVSPPLIPTNPPPGASYSPFKSLGIRIPAMIVSPLVKEGWVCNELFDNTSVLKFIAEKFAPDGKYSDVVDKRPVESVSIALNLTEPPRTDTHLLPFRILPETMAARDVTVPPKPHAPTGYAPGTPATATTSVGFREILKDRYRRDPEGFKAKFPGLLEKYPDIAGV